MFSDVPNEMLEMMKNAKIHPDFYYHPLTKKRTLIPSPLGTLDIPSLLSGQILYSHYDEAKGEPLKKTLLITDWTYSTFSSDMVPLYFVLLEQGFKIYFACEDELIEASEDAFKRIEEITSRIKPIPPEEAYKRIAKCGFSRDQVLLLDRGHMKYMAYSMPFLFGAQADDILYMHHYTEITSGYIGVDARSTRGYPLRECVASIEKFSGLEINSLADLDGLPADLADASIRIERWNLDLLEILDELQSARVTGLYQAAYIPHDKIHTTYRQFAKFPNLTSLQLPTLHFGDWRSNPPHTKPIIAKQHHDLSALRNLSLLFGGLDESLLSEEMLGQILANGSKLKVLALNACRSYNADAFDQDMGPIGPLAELEQFAAPDNISINNFSRIVAQAPALKSIKARILASADDKVDPALYTQRFEQLEFLSFKRSSLSFEFILTFLSLCPNLKHLKLRHMHPDDKIDLTLYTQRFEQLELLSFKDSSLSAAFLLTFLDFCPNLKCLDLKYLDITDTAETPLSLPILNQLEALTVEGSNLSDAGLLGFLQKAPRLKALQASEAQLNMQSRELIAERNIELIETPKPTQYHTEYQSSPHSVTISTQTTRIEHSAPADHHPTHAPAAAGAGALAPKPSTAPYSTMGIEKSPAELAFTNYFYKVTNSETIIKPKPHYYRLQLHLTIDIDSSAPTIRLIKPRLEKLKPLPLPNNNKEFEYLGTYPLAKHTKEWQALPSLSCNEEIVFLKARSASGKPIAIEMAYHSETRQYYVRQTTSTRDAEVFIYYGLNIQEPSTVTLPTAIAKLVTKYQSFDSKEFDFSTLKKNYSGRTLIDAIKMGNRGACRHRVVAFVDEFNALTETTTDLKSWKVITVVNQLHTFVELLYDGQHIAIDLGGTPVAITEQSNSIDAHLLLDEISNKRSAEFIKSSYPLLVASKTNAKAISDFTSPLQLLESYPTTCLIAKSSSTIEQLILLWRNTTKADMAADKIQFINASWQLGECATHDIVVINITDWNAREKVKLHELLDSAANHGKPRVILLDTTTPSSRDFASRLTYQHALSDKEESTIINRCGQLLYKLAQPQQFLSQKATLTLTAPVYIYGTEAISDALTIDFYGNQQAWPMQLFGKLNISDDGALGWALDSRFMELFSTASSTKTLILRNPPQDPRFWQWLQLCIINQKLSYPGMDDLAWPKDLNIAVQFGYEANAELTKTLHSSEPGTVSLALNYSSFNYYFSIIADDSGHIAVQAGWLEQYANKIIELIVTENLSLGAWMQLINEAHKHNTILNISVFAGVSLPKEIQTLVTSTALAAMPAALTLDERTAIKIPLAALNFADLSGQWHKNAHHTLQFIKSDLSRHLTEASDDKASVIFYGDIESLTPAVKAQIYLAVKNKQWQVNGCLQDIKVAVTYLETKHWALPPQTPMGITLKPAGLDDFEIARLSSVCSILDIYPWVIIEGETGIGKTHFFYHSLVPQLNAQAHVGIDAIKDWANDRRPGPKLLLLDEANIDTDLNWLISLAYDPSRVWWQGKCFALTNEHRIVLACNPHSYGGERSTSSLLAKTATRVSLLPYKSTDILEKTLSQFVDTGVLPADRASFMASLFASVTSALSKTALTPREWQMAALLTANAVDMALGFKKCHESEVWEKAAIFAILSMAEQILDKQEIKIFEQLAKQYCFKQLKEIFLTRNNLTTQTNDTHTFVPEYNEVAAHLDYILNIHLWRNSLDKSERPKLGLGLSALVLNGSPGIGKTHFLEAASKSMGFSALTEDALFDTASQWQSRAYIRVPTDASFSRKEKILRTAFSQGHVVIIDEINCGIRLEKVMNELLDSMQTTPAKMQQGYGLILATQNPVHFAGRSIESLATRHRQWNIDFPEDYSESSLLRILATRNPHLPDSKTEKLVDAYTKAKKLASSGVFPEPNLRDLFKQADAFSEARKRLSKFPKTEKLIDSIAIRAQQLLTASSASEKAKGQKILDDLETLKTVIAHDKSFDFKELKKSFNYLSTDAEIQQQADDLKFNALIRIFNTVAIEHWAYKAEDFESDKHLSANIRNCFADVCAKLAAHRNRKSMSALFACNTSSVKHVIQHINAAAGWHNRYY